MNWVEELNDLYVKHQDIAGKIDYKPYKTKNGEGRTPLILLPIFHTTVAAQITVTIDGEGNFLDAGPVADEDKLTIIPVSEKSAVRTANPEPHPLCDNLKYLAGDYMVFYNGKKSKDFGAFHTSYMELLKRWRESEFTHAKVDAIFKYLEKGTLIRDLVRNRVLVLNENGLLEEKVKIQNIAQEDSFVRFRIQKIVNPAQGDGILGDSMGENQPECWKDRSLQQSFIDYTRSIPMEKGLCYLSGKMTQVSYYHPKKIRNEGDGSKLISSNDEQNYTFRGRFRDKGEAFSIGYEVSQQAHNALKWIIRKQGYNWDGLYVVIWESDLKKLPKIYEDTDTICGEAEEVWGDEEQPDEYTGTGHRGASRFQMAMRGYGKNLNAASKTVLLSLDAATTGRLAMTEFKEFSTTRYLENIQYWHESCGWIHPKIKDKTYDTYFGMAGVRDIAEILYGTEQNGVISLNGKTRMYARVMQRLLPCISEKKPIPSDLVDLAVRKASSPVSYDNRYNWERVLAVACSLVKKQRLEQKKEEWTVRVEEQCRDRSYLYGRLLAIADRIEYRTFDKEDGRTTNAKRYMTAFSQRPSSTWKLLEERLQPYLQRLSQGERIHYLNLLDEVESMAGVDDFKNDKALDSLYLLGFHSQSYDMKHKKEEETNE